MLRRLRRREACPPRFNSLHSSGASNGRYPDPEKIRGAEPLRDQGRAHQSRQGHLQADAVRVSERRARQSQLDRHDAARRLFPARTVRHHRKQAGDGASGRGGRHASGEGNCRPVRSLARQAFRHAGRQIPHGDAALRDQEVRLRAGCLRPRTRRFHHRRQLSGAGPHAGAQREDRARISDVGRLRRADAGRQVRHLRGRGRHGCDVLPLQVAEGQPPAGSRRHHCAGDADLHALHRDDAPGGLRPQGGPDQGPAGKQIPVHRRGNQEAGGSEDQGLLRRQSVQSVREWR